MNPKKSLLLLTGMALLMAAVAATAQNGVLNVQWINGLGQNAATILNNNLSSNAFFITSFKATNDFIVTRLTADAVTTPLYVDIFGGVAGNNPAYLTNFVGATSNYTGNGTAGGVGDLDMTSDANGTLQFDFLARLTPLDRILLIDIDGPEEYQLQAYVTNGASYVQVGTTNWIAQEFSGTTGELPNANWPVWNGTNGIVNSGANVNLNEELFVLTPDRPIDRLVVSKLASSGWSTDITFVSLSVTPAPLHIQAITQNRVVLTWTNSLFSLQSSGTLTGTFTNLPNATSPYTNSASSTQQFFRLTAN